MNHQESARWQCRYQVSKYREDIGQFSGSPAEFQRAYRPYEVKQGAGNCLLNSGIDEMWDLICGDSANHFNAAATQLGVGDSAAAAAPAQTDLQSAVNKAYKSLDSGYPVSQSQKVTFQATFTAAEANFTWNEWVIKQSASGKCLNRKAESFGVKSGGTWVLQVAIELS